MADNGFKINKSVNFNPQAAVPANPIDGDFYYDSTIQSFVHYHDGSWANLNSVGIVTATDPLTSVDFTPAVVQNSVIKVMDAVAPIHLAGISSSFSAKQITIYNGGTDLITVEHEDAAELTSNNRIRTPTAGDMNLIAGEVAVFTYDIVTNRWLLVSISSQGGAQVIATDSHPGLVQLHQNSLFPADGIVLSDGDLNTATGVVGLDANKAAAITAPLSAVTALAITAHADASALVLTYGSGTVPVLQISACASSALTQKPGSDVDQFVLNDTILQLGKRQLKFSDNDGSANHLDNYMVYSYLGATSRRGMQFVNAASAGSTSFFVEGVNDGLGGAQVDLTLRCSSTADQVISNIEGNLYLNRMESQSVYIGFDAAASITISSGDDLWQFLGTGVFTAVDENRAIQMVLDPVNAQDAATKNYVDNARFSANLVMNGDFAISKRAPGGTFAFDYGVKVRTLDRWNMINSWAAVVGSVSRTVPNPAFAGVPSVMHVTRTAADAGIGYVQVAQEIDRDLIHAAIGQPLTLTFWAVKGADYSSTDAKLFIVFATGTGALTEERLTTGTYTTGDNIDLNTFISPTTSWVKYTLAIPALRGTVTCAQLRFTRDHTGTAAGDDSFSIADVMLNIGSVAAPFALAHGSGAAEEAACLKYYENSYYFGQGEASSSADTAWTTAIVTAAAMTAGDDFVLGMHPKFRAQKRIAVPTISLWGPTGTPDVWDNASVDRAVRADDKTATGFILAADGSFTPSVGFFRGHWACEAEF
jgi:hypothetical protein